MAKIKKSGRKITQIMQQITRKKRVKQIAFFTVLVVIIVFFASGSRGTYQLYKFNKQKQDLESELKELESEKAKLEQMKTNIENDPEYIEKIAREKYKMKKKEEKVYEIVEE